MDEKDLRILSAVATQKTASPDAIHKATGIPKSTVHYRLDQLRTEGVVEDDLLNVDLTKVGLSLTLVTEVWAEYEHGYQQLVGERISDIEGVNQVYFTLGDTDFVVITHLASRQMVEDLIEAFEAIDEIKRTRSQFVIKTIKDEPSPLADYSLETLVEVLLDDEEE